MSIQFHIGALLSYLSILGGYYLINPYSANNWKKWNSTFSVEKLNKIAIFLFIFALACYIPFRGFSLSALTTSSQINEFDWDNQKLNYYFVGMISLFVVSCCLLLINFKKNKLLFLIFLWITLVTYIISGFRYRIVILIISMFSTYYLYFPTKRIKILPVLIIAAVCYIGFNVMDHARYYGSGLRADVIQSMTKNDLKRKAGETERVYNYSIMVMNRYDETGKRLYFGPIVNAICLPIPRVIFPWKPKAEYMYETTEFVMRGQTGSAYVNFVEAFMSFGWLGVILNGLFIGWLSRRFWNNYRNNSDSLGAILAMALFNGVTYVIVSRGYLAQELNIFIYFVCIPFWLAMLFRKLSRNKIS